MLKFTSLLLILFCSSLALSQRPTRLSRTELGFLAGGMYYIGDLNPSKQFNNTKLAGGLIYRFNVHSRISIRGNLIYGNIMGDDAKSKDLLFRNRNLNFSSSILEVSGGVEFNYMPFEIGHEKYKGTAYLLAQMGVFHMNPKTDYNGVVYSLQQIGTEGQGTKLSSKKNYSLTQLCIPIGAGVRMTFGKRASLNLELGLRKTFTDYMDDIHSDTYVDPAKLEAESGSIAVALSNRSLDKSRFGKRGTSSTNDWYVFSGLMLTFKLGEKSNCFYHN